MNNEDIVQALHTVIDITNRYSREYDAADEERQKMIFLLFHAIRHLPTDLLWKIEDPEGYELHWQAMVELMSGEEDADGE